VLELGDFSVKAILSAVDKNFTSTMKSATGYVDNLKSTLSKGLGFGMLMGAGQAAFSALSSGASSLCRETVDTSDAMQKLQQAMRFSGSSEAEIQRIAGATGTLKTYADKTVFSLQDVMSTFGALSANGIKDADKMTEAVGNAVAVFGGGAREFSSVGLAYSQAMASGALHAQDWNQILNASPQLAGGLKKELIKLNPVLGEDFKQAMEDGAITADLLGQAMNNIGMTDLAKDAATSVTTFEGAMGNLEATAQSGMMKLYDTFAKSKVIDVINGLTDKVGAGFDWISGVIPKAIDTISPYWQIFKENALEVKDAFGDAVSAIGKEMKELEGSFGSTESIASFSEVMETGADALKKFAGFLKEHSDVIAKVLPQIPKLLVAYKGFQIVKAVAPFVGTFSKGILLLAGKGVGKIAGKLFGISKSQKEVGEASLSSSKQMFNSALAFLALGAGVALVSGGFYLLAQAAVELANAGPLAIGIMAGLVLGVVAIGAGMAFLLKSLAPMGTQLIPVAAAMLALGAAVLLVSVSFGLLAFTAIQLANAGPLAIAVMVGMVAAIALLAVGAAALGPALTAGAVGFIAFGAAILLVGAGALLASAALAVVAAVLPIVVAYGIQGAAAIALLGAGLLAFGVGAAVAGAGCVVLGAGLLVVGAGLTLVGAAALVGAAGVTTFALAMITGAAGTLLMATALKSANSSMKSISKNAKSAENSLSSMRGSVDVVSSGLDAIGNKAKSAMKSLINAFDNAAGKATTSGQKVGNNFNNGLRSGSSKAVVTATTISASVASALSSASSGAYSAGVNIGAGLVNGMQSMVGAAWSAAAELASAAEAAIRAKAQIHSPSRVSGKLAKYFGQGWVDNLRAMTKEAWSAAQELVSIPDVPSVGDVRLAYAGDVPDLSGEYDYNSNVYVRVESHLDVDGREVAKVTAPYTKEELDKIEKREDRKHGRR
jgi:tape measure domain-containing protein